MNNIRYLLVVSLCLFFACEKQHAHFLNKSSENLDSTKKFGNESSVLSATNGLNIALGKPVTSGGTLTSGIRITDGNKNSANYAGAGSNLSWIQIDLGYSAKIDEIKLWHYFSDARTYHDVIVRVSNNASFSSGVTTVFNNDTNNSAGFGTGTDTEYTETSSGKSITFTPLSARYVRLYTNGNTVNSSNHYVEVEVWSVPYDSLVLSDNPVGFWMQKKGYMGDASGHGMTGAYYGSGRPETTLPNGETASVFNGTDNYFEVPDNDYLEVTRTGILTIEAWMRPDVTVFPHSQYSTDGNYVHWMGKGTASNHLWVARIYDYTTTGSRSQRISGYCFNLTGGLGAGSYFQDVISTGTWIHYVLVINTVNTSGTYPTGYTKIYRDGVLRDTDSLSGYSIIPGNGNAPMRIATRDLASFFKGAIGKVAVYDYELTASQLLAHNNNMRGI